MIWSVAILTTWATKNVESILDFTATGNFFSRKGRCDVEGIPNNTKHPDVWSSNQEPHYLGPYMIILANKAGFL